MNQISAAGGRISGSVHSTGEGGEALDSAPVNPKDLLVTRRSSPVGWLIACGVLLITAIAVGTVTMALNFRDRALLNSNRELQNTALLLSQYILAELKALDLVQNSLIERIHADGVDDPGDYTRRLSGRDIHLVLKEKIVGLPQVEAVGLLDSSGRLINSSRAWPFTPLDYSSRDYFKALSANTSLSTFVSGPLRNRDGAWTMVLAHKVTSSDGQFLGIVTGGLALAQFEKYFESVALGETSSITLFRSDGLLLARYPVIDSVVGRRFSGLADSLGEADAGTARLVGKIDGMDRLLAAHRVSGFPLVVVAGRETSAALADWQRQTRALLAIGSFSILVTALIVFLIVRKMAQEHRWSKERLLSEKRRLDSTIANMPHGVCMYGPDQRLVVANDLYSTMYGLNPEQAEPGTTLRAILETRVAVGSSPKGARDYITDRLAEAFLPEPGYIINELRDGRVIAISRRPMPDGGSVAIHQDITAQKRAEEKILHLAHYDALTDLANRVLFLEQVDKALGKCRTHNALFAVYLLDLDRFKEVNDSLGHAVGDSLLFEVASRVRACVGPDDIVARLGGDEFAVLQAISGCGANEVALLAEKLLGAIAQPFCIGSHQLTIETSIGVALAPDDGLDGDELLKRADLALYRVKSDGRNSWRFFESAMEQEARSRLTLAMDLRSSVARGEFELHYQPVVSSIGETVIGMEALVRWQNPQLGLVSPDKFIPVAEDTGLIVPLGEWILHRACHDAVRWPSHLTVAVNLSPVQFRSGELVNSVKRALAEANLPASRLELEVTESVLLEHNEQNYQILRQLQKLGIAIVLDDFGTGYSSMSYLLSFPFDKIKIDRKFVSEVTRRSDCAAIVSAVSSLARSLNITTTAEGVETREQLVLLRAAGCTLMQGYLFGRPRPDSELVFETPSKIFATT